MKKTNFALVLFLSFCFLISAQEQAQEKVVSGKFVRTSVTIVPLTDREASKFLPFLLKDISLPEIEGRFDYNPLELSNFKDVQSLYQNVGISFTLAEGEGTLTQISDVLRKSDVLKKIIESAGNPDSIQARFFRAQKRIVTSASEQMKINKPTINEEMAVLNNAFVGVLILNKVEPDKEDVKASGHIYWFRINVKDVTDWNTTTGLPAVDEVKLDFVKHSATSQSSAELVKVKEKTQEEKEQLAVGNFGQSIFKLALSMEEFKIRGTIQDATEGYRFDLGNREGVYLDEGFKVFELMMQDDNKLKSEYIGFGRVDMVGDNNTKIDALSNLYSIIGSYEQGNTLTSYDQGPDVIVRAGYSTLSIPKEVGNLFGNEFENDAKEALSINVAVLQNIAKLTKVKQLFIGLSGTIILPKLSLAASSSTLTVNRPMVFEGNLLVQKKFWFKRIALIAEVNGGITKFAISGKDASDTDWEINTGYQIGFGGSAALEFAINADMSLGVDIGYRYVMAPTEIKVTYGTSDDTYTKSDNETLWSNYKLNDLNLGGLKFAARFQYTLPSF